MNLEEAMEDAARILDDAVKEHLGARELVATVVLFSGGNDSAVLFDYMVRTGRATHAAHANTTIGIEATRQHVRDTVAAAGLPLLEELPPATYRELVLERGFPGPGQHMKMFQRLKDKPLRQARRHLVVNGYRQRVLYVAGRRRAESARRSDVPETERVDSVIWASPLANWSDDLMAEYRARFKVPESPVAAVLGMSGECLCGAFAEPGELHRIAEHYPEAAQEIADLESYLAENMDTINAAGWVEDLAKIAKGVRAVTAARKDGAHPAKVAYALNALAARRRKLAPRLTPDRCRWGWGAYRGDPDGPPPLSGPLCSSCDFRSDPAVRAENTPAVQAIINRRRAS